MKWVLGLDLREYSRGAIAMARWLHGHDDTPDRHRFVGVHVIEETYRVSVRDDELDELCAQTEAAIGDSLSEVEIREAFMSVEVVPGVVAERSLEAAAVYHHAQGLVVGRHATRDGLSVVRLGRVARRLVRRLPVPVMVVPPDLTLAEVGAGPVLATSDLSPQSAASVRFARQFADSIGRTLEVIHVDTLPVALGYPPGTLLPPTPRFDRKAAETKIAQWVDEHGLRVDGTRVVEGDVVLSVAEAAHEMGAPLVVCGSRRLSLAERVFQSSVGTELARTARCPVVIAPASQPEPLD